MFGWFEAERLVPGWIVVRAIEIVNKREKQRKEEIVGFHFLLFSSLFKF
jgi:hypothetical protein|uniref:Uncharacterized protein n=1 Tax=Populus trichocarpa TaxID=3694 RepID=A0A3N7FWD0_POPTR